MFGLGKKTSYLILFAAFVVNCTLLFYGIRDDVASLPPQGKTVFLLVRSACFGYMVILMFQWAYFNPLHARFRRYARNPRCVKGCLYALSALWLVLLVAALVYDWRRLMVALVPLLCLVGTLAVLGAYLHEKSKYDSFMQAAHEESAESGRPLSEDHAYALFLAHENRRFLRKTLPPKRWGWLWRGMYESDLNRAFLVDNFFSFEKWSRLLKEAEANPANAESILRRIRAEMEERTGGYGLPAEEAANLRAVAERKAQQETKQGKDHGAGFAPSMEVHAGEKLLEQME